MRKFSDKEARNVERSLNEMTKDEQFSLVVSLLEENEELKRKVLQLKAEVSDMNWTINPDRMGGSLTDYEKYDQYAWR